MADTIKHITYACEYKGKNKNYSFGLVWKKNKHFDINKESEMSAYNEAYKPKLLRA